MIYITSKDSNVFTWMQPEQTEGKKYPYLYTYVKLFLVVLLFQYKDTPANNFHESLKYEFSKI